jgi:hypothetical protein
MTETLLQTEIVTVRAHGDLFFVAWHKKGSAEIFRAITEHERGLRRKLGERPMARLNIVANDAITKPSAELQAAIDERSKIANDWLKAEALVIDATGFSAALMRSLIATANLVNRPAFPYKVLSDPGAGIDWIAPHVLGPDGQPVTAAALRADLI